MATVLVTGATGLLAPYVVEAAHAAGVVVASSRTGGDVRADLNDDAEVRRLMDRVGPDVVLHTAALTDVEWCETHPDDARLVNRQMVANLVGALRPSTMLVVFSTDQVYADVRGPHREG